MLPLVAVLTLGALAAPAAASAAAPTLFKVSAYGVQRYATHSESHWEEGCRGERGEQSLSVVTRFTTPRTTRVRLVRYGPVTALQPATKRDWMLKGTSNARASGSGETASCAAVNPDSSIKWVPSPPLKARCSGVEIHQDGTVKLEGRKLSFGASDTLLTPLTNEFETCKADRAVADLATATATISPRQIAEANGEPIVLRFRDEGGSAGDTSSSEWRKRLTAYVTFTPVR